MKETLCSCVFNVVFYHWRNQKVVQLAIDQKIVTSHAFLCPSNWFDAKELSDFIFFHELIDSIV